MLYRNVSEKAAYVSVQMNKTKVNPGEEVNLSIRDINHSGSSLRFFEAVIKVEEVRKEKLDIAENEETTEVVEKIKAVEEPVEEPKEEAKAKSEPEVNTQESEDPIQQETQETVEDGTN